MTKLALVLALAGMFGFGYATGGRRGHGPEAQQDVRKAPTKGRPAHAMARAGHEGALALARDPAAAPSASETTAAQESSGGDTVSPASLEILNSGPGITYRGNNVEFSHLMQSCRDVEASWHKRTLEGKVHNTWSVPEDEERPDYSGIYRTFIGARQVSAHWIANVTIPVGGRDVDLRLHIDYIMDHLENEIPCWSFSDLYQTGGTWQFLGGNGGCGIHETNPDGAPIVSDSVYDNKELGTLVSSFIFPVDVTKPGQLEFLPAAEGSEWQTLNITYSPMSDAEYDEEMKARSAQ